MTFSQFSSIFCISAFFFSTSAHINKTSLSIKGGETFVAGDTVRITWKISIFHNRPHIIFFSPGTGQAWQKIDSVPEKSGVMDMSYTWTVPLSPSPNARIRIFQSFVASPGEQTNDYTIVSNTFVITSGATAVISKNQSARVMRQTVQIARKEAMFDLNGRLIDESNFIATRGRAAVLRRLVGR